MRKKETNIKKEFVLLKFALQFYLLIIKKTFANYVNKKDLQTD